jgi:uncharacterized membrane protein required for colicin V production
MHLDKIYAGYLINAANLYASQRATACKQSETWLEQKLLRLFEEAASSGIEKQDIAVIASTAIAVVLNKAPDSDVSDKRRPQKPLRLVKSA